MRTSAHRSRLDLRLLTNELGGRLDYDQPEDQRSDLISSPGAMCADQAAAKRLQAE